MNNYKVDIEREAKPLTDSVLYWIWSLGILINLDHSWLIQHITTRAPSLWLKYATQRWLTTFSRSSHWLFSSLWLQSPQELNDCHTGFLHFFQDTIYYALVYLYFLLLHVHANKNLYKCALFVLWMPCHGLIAAYILFFTQSNYAVVKKYCEN